MNQPLPMEWDLGRSDQGVTVAFAVVQHMRTIVNEQTPEFNDLFPFVGAFRAEFYADNQSMALRLTDVVAMQIPVIDQLGVAQLQELKSKLGTLGRIDPKRLIERLGTEWFAFNKFTYVGPYRSNYASWPDVCEHIVYWANNIVAPEILRRNQLRVLKAIPPTPSFDGTHISSALWVLECEQTMRQGTAFELKGVGLVTCDHVLGSSTVAFRADQPAKKYPVRVLQVNPTLDLAILGIGAACDHSLEHGSADGLKQMDHVMVAGFPNYRLGDTGVLVPGLVTGFRTVSGIRRILTNAQIVAGTSGGPVIDAGHRVVGIAVTGADLPESAHLTENHGIIPIDALKFLRNNS